MTASSVLSMVVLISGSGTNLQALIDAAVRSRHFQIAAVVSNRPGVRGLSRAEAAGIPAHVVDHRHYEQRDDFDTALMGTIDHYEPDLVALAGFMRILTAGFVRHYTGRLLNIHPSLLPRYRGLYTHRRALEAGEREHGASVHFVTDELDGGPTVLQAGVPVHADDTPESLAARVLEKEHIIYPMVIDWYARGELSMVDERVMFRGKPLEAPLRYPDDTREQ